MYITVELGGMAHTDFGSVSDIPGLNTTVSVSVFDKNREKSLKLLDEKIAQKWERSLIT